MVHSIYGIKNREIVCDSPQYYCNTYVDFLDFSAKKFGTFGKNLRGAYFLKITKVWYVQDGVQDKPIFIIKSIARP